MELLRYFTIIGANENEKAQGHLVPTMNGSYNEFYTKDTTLQ